MVKNESIEIKRIVDVLKGKLVLIIFILIIFMLLGYAYSYYYVVPKYKSTETLLLIPNNETEEQRITSSDLTLNSGLISTYSNIAKEPKVLRQVIDNLNLNMSEKELLNKLKVNVTMDTYIIEITVADTNAQRANDITRELSEVFLKEIKEIYNLENIGIVDEAEIAEAPYNIKHTKDMIMFFGMGVFVSCIVVFATIMLDNTVKTERDIEEYTELKALGKIPVNLNKNHEIVTRENAKSYVTECINTIRTNILYMNSVKTAKTILVTSCRAQEGKSWTSANIAASFAETNKKVLLIDADLRKGRTNKIFNIEKIEGLSNYLYFMTGEAKKDLELAKKYIKETEVPGLHVLTNGSVPPNPAELLESSNMLALLAMLKKLYDIIIIDSPPSMLVTDSVILSTIADSTILVVNSESTKINELIKVKKSIEMVGGNLIGAILNKVKVEGKTYSKSYYYGHADTENKCETKKREVVTVEDLVDNAILKLELKKEILEENEIEEVVIPEKEIQNNDKKTDNSEQNKYLNRIIDVILDVKSELYRNQNNNIERFEETEKAITGVIEIINSKVEELKHNNNIEIYKKLKDINYREELDAISNEMKRLDIENISNEIKKVDNTEELQKLSNELEKLKEKLASIDYKEELEKVVSKVYEEMLKIKEDNRELMKKAEDISYIDTIIDNINSEKLTKEELENIVNKKTLTREDISSIIKQEQITEEEIEYIINKNRLTVEQVQKIVQNEMQNIDYTEQFSKLEEMILNLKDNYLEISNRITKEQFGEEENITTNNENIINISLFRKDRQAKKKKSYSIREDIEYTDLENSAVCIIPFIQNSASEEYKEIVSK